METKSGPNSEIPHDYKPYLTLDIVKQDTFQNTMGPENLFRSVIMHHLPRVEDMAFIRRGNILRFPHNNVSSVCTNVLKVCVFDRLTDTAVWQIAPPNCTMVIAFIDTVHRQYIIEHQEICIRLSCFLFMICFAVLCRRLSTLILSEVKLITLYYCQSMLVFN